MPAFKKTDEPFAASDVNDLIIMEKVPAAKICQTVPSCVKETVSYVIDTSKLGSHRDLSADDTGKWVKHKCPSQFLQVVDGRVNKIFTTRCDDAKFQLKRHYSDHESGALKRTII
jgi:hypothetical protein